MKQVLSLAFAASLLLAGNSQVFAADNMSGSSMQSMHAMPTCAAGDPVVGVNTNSKMYMSMDQMKAKSAGMTPAQKQAMMTKNHVTMMCKSKADAMGAKMMPSKM